jgi:hypothetical protein
LNVSISGAGHFKALLLHFLRLQFRSQKRKGIKKARKRYISKQASKQDALKMKEIGNKVRKEKRGTGSMNK